MIAIRQINRKALIGIILILTCIGCAYLRKEPGEKKTAELEPAPPAKTDQTTSRFLHTVRWSGETLSIIAKWYTGNPENWEALTKANPGLKPNRIFIGNKILIPADLLKTREPMPKGFLSVAHLKGTKKASPSKMPDTGRAIEEKAVPPKKSARFLHTVKWKRETLSIIAKWYTGKYGNWKAVAKANPRLKPNKIILGNKILIPEDLLKTREPMTREFLSEVTTGKKKKATPPESTPPPEEDKEPELIGPKDYPKK